MIAEKRDIRLILDNIRSVHNVGSIFRTAETLGIKKIYCLSTTPTPIDRFGRSRKDFAKVSLGSESMVSWEHVGAAVGVNEESADGRGSAGKEAGAVVKAVKILINKLKKEGFKLIALEQAKGSIDYKEIELDEGRQKTKVAIILGNEVDGVSSTLLKEADVIAEIPLLGKKESLNVSVAGAIFLYRLLDVAYRGRRLTRG